jgi:hypothetical protein
MFSKIIKFINDNAITSLEELEKFGSGCHIDGCGEYKCDH